MVSSAKVLEVGENCQYSDLNLQPHPLSASSTALRDVLPILGRQKVFLAKCGLESRPVVPKHDQSCLLLMAKKRGQPPLEPIRNRQRVAPRTPSPPRHQGSPSASAIATPTGAQFNSAATISPSPSGVPPLGEGGLMKLVERFGVMRLGAESLLPPNVRQLNKKPDDFRTRLNTHLETNDLKKETEEAEGATQMATTTMRDAAAVACLRRSSAAALAAPALPSTSLASAVHASTDPASARRRRKMQAGGLGLGLGLGLA